MATFIEILDSDLNFITRVKSPVPLDKSGTILQYSKELSDFGQCKFRISNYDPAFTSFGDITKPHRYHVRINRNGSYVWQGAIIENSRRTKDFTEVIAAEYVWYLGKLLVNRTSVNPLGTGKSASVATFSMSNTDATITATFPDGINPSVGGTVALSGFSPSTINGTWPITSVGTNTVVVTITGGPISATTLGSITFSDGIYRIFSNGYMGDNVTQIMNEVISRYQGTNHALASLSIGTIENPDFPPNLTNGEDPPGKLTGVWIFGNGIDGPQLTFDFHSVLYVLKSFGVYTYADFNIDSNLQFNFKRFLGNDHHYDVNFVWGKQGNAVDFNITRLGQRQINDMWGIAVDNTGLVLHYDQSDQDSIKQYGILEGVAAYADIKDQGTLNARIAAELPLISTAEESADTFVLNEKAYPLGLYDIGDIITAKVNHTALTYDAIKRIVGISVSLNDTGRELTTVQLNTPLPWQYGAS